MAICMAYARLVVDYLLEYIMRDKEGVNEAATNWDELDEADKSFV